MPSSTLVSSDRNKPRSIESLIELTGTGTRYYAGCIKRDIVSFKGKGKTTRETPEKGSGQQVGSRKSDLF